MANSNARLALLIVTLMFGTNLAPKGRPQRGDRGGRWQRVLRRRSRSWISPRLAKPDDCIGLRRADRRLPLGSAVVSRAGSSRRDFVALRHLQLALWAVGHREQPMFADSWEADLLHTIDRLS
jgi:hypothetical protein